MILDKDNMLSEDQTIAAVASTIVSTNVVDLSVVKKGEGNPIPISVQITDAVLSTGSATVQLIVMTDNDVAFGSPTTVFTSAAIAKAALVAGYTFLIKYLPDNMERYVRVSYVIAVETTSAGTVTASVGSAPPSNT